MKKEIKHKDPSGKQCEGRSDPQFDKCYHCDICPFTECAQDVEQDMEQELKEQEEEMLRRKNKNVFNYL